MKKILLAIVLCFLFTLSLHSSYALSQNTIHLLTVAEQENGSFQGGVASLDLEIKPGTGSIFIESFPLSNIDTQAVTRIATDIACDYAQTDCSQLDFFYTITTNSGLVRGPSAGGATALLALATLQEISLEPLAMTGGISSGGLITPVGGVAEKTAAAQEQGIDIILIPELSLNISNNETNETPLQLSDMQTNPQSVYPVYSLSQAYHLATQKSLPVKQLSEPPTYYAQRMKETAQLLCTRSLELFSEVQDKGLNVSTIARDFYNKSQASQTQGNYYSSASYCYSANLRLREQLTANMTQTVLEENYYRLLQSINFYEAQIDSYSLKTFSDLEAYIIVKERLYESQEYLDQLNTSNLSSPVLALAIERYYSAVAWSEFFGLTSEPLQIDERSLERACIEEIREAEARSNYVKTILPEFLLGEMTSQLANAYEHYNENNYPLCIFKASKAKATAHLFMNNVQDESQLPAIYEVKTARTKELIANEQEQGIFPIIGYSYYEYSQTLFDDEPYTGLLFMEYAMTMSDVSKYFPKTNTSLVYRTINSELFYFFLGVLFGYVLFKLLSKEQPSGEMRTVKKKSSKKSSSKKK